MRNFITWTLSILLGFEPALWAQGQAERMATIKNFIEQSQIAQKPMKLKDLYKHTFADASDSQKAEYRKFMEAYGDLQMPKMDVSRVKGPNGTEFYRIQAVQNGQSVTVELIDDGTTFARVNGKNLSYDDLRTPQKTMQALGVPPQAISEFFPAKPVSSSDFLNFEQFQQLKVEDRNKYMNHIRQLLESMEAVEYSFGHRKTSSTEDLKKFDLISFLFQGSNAWAAAGDCVAAGQIVKGGSTTGRTCGVDANGNVPLEYRKHDGKVFCTESKSILCNLTVYPTLKPICVPAGRESTQLCNERIKGDKEVFEYAVSSNKTAEEFQQMKRDVEGAAANVWAICQENPGSDDTSVFDSLGTDPKGKPQAPKKGTGKGKVIKGKKTPSPDQKYHCERFKDRVDEIKSWCGNPDSQKAYPKLCPGKIVDVPIKDEKKPVTPPPVVVTPTPQPAETCPAGQICCDNLPNHMSKDKGACDASGGSVSRGECYNPQTKTTDFEVYVCSCPGGLDGKMKCAGQKVSDTDKTGKEKKKTKSREEKDKPNYWLFGGITLFLGWLFSRVYRAASIESFKKLEPQPQNPPLPPPVTTPAPGPLPPPPRSGGAI